MLRHYPFTPMLLPYRFDALCNHISTRVLFVHYERNYKAYIKNLNEALSGYPQYQNYSLEELITSASQMPDEIAQKVKNNAGGVYNHELYFCGMAPVCSSPETGKLKEAVAKNFGSYEKLCEKLKEAAVSVFGSGWAYVVSDYSDSLKIITTKNQDTPLELSLNPILAVDVWEHAYFLQYLNRRDEYYDNWFKVVNKAQAEKNFLNNVFRSPQL